MKEFSHKHSLSPFHKSGQQEIRSKLSLGQLHIKNKMRLAYFVAGNCCHNCFASFAELGSRCAHLPVGVCMLSQVIDHRTVNMWSYQAVI